MPRNVNVWRTQKGEEADLRIEWTDDEGKPKSHAEKIKVKDLAKLLPDEWVLDKYIEMTISGTLPRIEAMADAPSLTFWQRVGQWFMQNSTILQWLRKREG